MCTKKEKQINRKFNFSCAIKKTLLQRHRALEIEERITWASRNLRFNSGDKYSKVDPQLILEQTCDKLRHGGVSVMPLSNRVK